MDAFLTEAKIFDARARTVILARELGVSELFDFSEAELLAFGRELGLDSESTQKLVTAITLRKSGVKDGGSAVGGESPEGVKALLEHLVISTEESAAHSSLLSRLDSTSALVSSLQSCFQELDASEKQCVADIDSKMDDFKQQLDAWKGKMLADMSAIEEDKGTKLAQQLSALRKHSDTIADARIQYAKLINDESLEVYTRKKQVLEVSSSALSSLNASSLRLCTAPRVAFGWDAPCVSSLVARMRVSDCNQPLAPLLFLQKAAATKCTVFVCIPLTDEKNISEISIEYAKKGHMHAIGSSEPLAAESPESGSKKGGKKKRKRKYDSSDSSDSSSSGYSSDSHSDTSSDSDWDASDDSSDDSSNTSDSDDSSERRKKKRKKRRKQKRKMRRHSGASDALAEPMAASGSSKQPLDEAKSQSEVADASGAVAVEWMAGGRVVVGTKEAAKRRVDASTVSQELAENGLEAAATSVYSLTVAKLKDESDYLIRARCKNASGWSVFCEAICVFTQKLTIASRILKAKEKETVVSFLPSAYKSKRFKLLYRASKHGFAAAMFHASCDGKGATLTVCKSKCGNVFGGFTAVAWTKANVFQSDKRAFLFLLRQKKGKSKRKKECKVPCKWPVKHASKAVYHGSGNGPTFGDGYDLLVANNCDRIGCTSNPGSAYKAPKSEKAMGGTNSFTLKDYEVFALK